MDSSKQGIIIERLEQLRDIIFKLSNGAVSAHLEDEDGNSVLCTEGGLNPKLPLNMKIWYVRVREFGEDNLLLNVTANLGDITTMSLAPVHSALDALHGQSPMGTLYIAEGSLHLRHSIIEVFAQRTPMSAALMVKYLFGLVKKAQAMIESFDVGSH